MNRSVEQALTSLIPRHNGPLPPELIELASSLLAQSRTKASTLKAEEEIGRTYACANIACERLKQTLNLPKIEPRPPCPPRIYTKLYTYLDSILLVRRSSRPPKPKSTDPFPPSSTPVKSTPTRALPSKPIPSKETSLAPYKTTPSRGPSSRRRGLQYADSTKEIAAWIHPTIRRLCKELDAPAAAPHILAGVTTVLTLPSPAHSPDGGRERREGGEKRKDKIPALIAAVYFFVSTRLVGREIGGKEYHMQRREVLGALAGMRGSEEEEEVEVDEGYWEGWERVGSKDVDGWLMEISTKGWLKIDWFENIVEGAGVEVHSATGQGEDGEEEDVREGNSSADGEGDGIGGANGAEKNVVQTGLGTMMLDRLDYLSERKRAEYKAWKQGILEKMRRIERGQGEMDVSDG